MHSRLLVTINKENAKNSLEAREYVQTELQNDDSFCGEGGRFGSPLADWFVIGGRWSGDLSFATVDESEFGKGVREITGTKESDCGYITSVLREKEKEITALWHKLGGVGQSPLNRDDYNEMGAEDDGQIVTKEIYEKIIKGLEVDGESFVDLDDNDEISEKFIGNKWIVVVDYHN